MEDPTMDLLWPVCAPAVSYAQCFRVGLAQSSF